MIGIAHGARASGKNYAFHFSIDGRDLVERMDLSVNVEYANATGDKLGILGPKIEDKNFFWHAQR